MLFNSYAFIFGFLPILLIGYSIAGLFHRKAVVIWLGLASLAFYGYWHPAFLVVLGGSILGNFLFARLISRAVANSAAAKALLWLAIAANLSLLGWFKYLFPFLRIYRRRLSHGTALGFCSASAWNFILHLHSDRLSRRPPTGSRLGPGFLQLPALCHVLSPLNRRPDPAP